MQKPGAMDAERIALLRVLGLRAQAMPETRTIENAFEPRAKASAPTGEPWQQLLRAGRTVDA